MDKPGDTSSSLARFLGPTGGNPSDVNRLARKLWNMGAALVMPWQMDALPEAARRAVEAEMEKAYGKRTGKNGR